MTIPSAPKIPTERTIHGETVIDEWFYLRDRENPATIPYLEAENRHTEESMRPAEGIRQTLYNEMLSRIQETDVSVPWRFGNHEYYSRTEQGRQYSIFCRRTPAKAGSAVAGRNEEVLLDQNVLAEGHEYFSLAFLQVSPDGNFLAYAVNTDGSEVYTLRFKDLRTGEVLPDQAHGVYYSADWAADSRTFFYTTLDATKRPYRLWRHEVGANAVEVLVYEEPDARFNVSIHRSRSGRFLFLRVDSHTTSEVYYLDAAHPDGEFRLFAPRAQDVEYFVEHQGDSFFIRTNEGAKNFRLMRAPVADPRRDRWVDVLPHDDEVAIESVDGFGNHLVVTERANGLKRLRIVATRDWSEHFVAFDEPVYTLFADRNEEYATTKFRFVYTSLVMPRSVYDYDMNTRERDLRKREPVLGGYDPEQYVSERIFATAPDGVRVPISLVHRKGFERDGQSPLYLYGYGAYGIVTEPSFSQERISLLDRGFVFAMAHIRGSADLGRRWYEEGKLLRKKNTFFDFIACAEHLVAKRYTSPDRMAIVGGSAGGLLMGAVTNMRPDLFGVVVAHVPFVDVVNTMLDPSLPLTVTEYEEWGNPNHREYYEYMRSYAPYENVGRKNYPHLLVTAGLNDPRVSYWEPAKWVARLREHKTDNNVLLLKTNMGAGHGGPSGRYERLNEKAFEYAFIIERLKQSA
ncbi:MAG TPA: S9 family peptidase [Bryobacteraceae bacterium]|nr:S9 family peptidase [Bryobacteraceae bacterium]